MPDYQITSQIIDLCQKLNQKQYLAACDGNISYRFSDKEILITPTGKNKAFIHPDEFSVIDLQNNVIKGQPSSESLMHLCVYKVAPQAKCVVHAHPPRAIAWSIANPDEIELPTNAMPEVVLGVGRIPIIPYARPGTDDLAESIKDTAPSCRAMILARHGAICWGENLLEAYNGIERVEHSAMILSYAAQNGEVSGLPPEELEWLHEKRKQIGNKIL